MLTILSRLRFLLAAVALLLGLAAPAVAQVTYPPRIGASDYIGDFADLITPADEEKVKASAAKLLTDQGIPLVVVTINSMADYGARNWPIERYAMNLFAEWGIGSTDRNAGVLLLVSMNDRKVRIEMGAAFTHERDVFAADVINRVIVPKFKAGQFSQGIVLGAEAIAAGIGQPTGKMQAGGMTGRTAPPAAPASGSSPTRTVGAGGLMKSLSGSLACFIIPIIIIVAFIAIRAFKRGPGYDGSGGAGGYGPTGWSGSRGGSGLGGMLGGLALGGLLGNAWGSRNRSDGGSIFGGSSSDSGSSSGGGFGGFSGGSFGGFGGGGSFGGGFSGGGGATGSW